VTTDFSPEGTHVALAVWSRAGRDLMIEPKDERTMDLKSFSTRIPASTAGVALAAMAISSDAETVKRLLAHRDGARRSQRAEQVYQNLDFAFLSLKKRWSFKGPSLADLRDSRKEPSKSASLDLQWIDKVNTSQKMKEATNGWRSS
jgi:hypothetical protein